MTKEERKAIRYSDILVITAWGSLWGIFEATVGYLLHLISFGYSWILWYPAACFFMANIYRKTKKASSVIYAGLLCAAVKMLNLFLPIRVDKVINPAISIVFEALAMAAVICLLNVILGNKRKNPFTKALAALGMNTLWRTMFALYLFFLVPDWIKDISVINSAKAFIPFFITQNIITSIILYIGYQFKNIALKPIVAIEKKILHVHNTVSVQAAQLIKMCAAAMILCVYVVLEMIL